MSSTLERCEHEGIKWFPRVTVEKYSPDQAAWAQARLDEELGWRRRPLVTRFGLSRLLDRRPLPVYTLHGDWLRDLFREPEDGYAHAAGNMLVAGGLYSVCGYLITGTAASGANGNPLKASTSGPTNYVGCGVGTSTTATVADTHLGGDGTSTTAFYQGQDLAYPASAGSGTANGGQLNGQCTITGSNADFAWNEWCWFTGTGTFATSGTGTYTLASAATNPLMLNHWAYVTAGGATLGSKGAGATWVFSTTITLS